ncbi:MULTISPECIES: protoporphyrinogen oxidase [unclassified Rhodococcus (in: high G+C Gram-positive bacteria)]|uniref:protoporphyrinogen oxidase n=1 Tax=unclassified Rhodococcus (in: high G+C Gram-positive bacteria) TaxID=192944 RepID=UPI000E0BF0F0|nr:MULTISPECIES: protoporphyrinogen oxidase [unclassified Rhodococcus (in: high G+C Gram-positive bacteria)]QKT11321.1 protoporphyrinogen oxidase [Rhodococcus sp. W8901]RDI16183.1 oxygen-dependent protoporphyrinogen oxidase [Rhodococcus sp. AG1013]
MTGRRVSVAVVGGGVTGLVAAYRLRQRLGDGARITVVEAGSRTGGKLRTVDLAGDPVDVGAEAFIARRPEVADLIVELGLQDQLVHPTGRSPLIWSQGSLHPLPSRTLMGIPSDPQSMAGLVDADTLARIVAEPTVPFEWDPAADVDVATLVGGRFGEQVVRRSVDPLLGGVYSGLSDSIGVRAALPTLAAALDSGAPSLSAAVRAALPTPSPGPVFGTLRDGYGVLLAALRDAAAPEMVLDASATGLRRDEDGWWIDPLDHVDGIVLAVPAPQMVGLVADAAPPLAEAARGIELASSAVVALALPTDAGVPENSGVLVATGESLGAKAFTLSSRKWPHLADRDVTLVRASYGRFGDAAVVDSTDEQLIAKARADLETVTGVRADPVDAIVARWHGGLPQYAPGHLDRVAAIEAAAADVDGLEIAGAYLHGVGVPACVASATTAATRLAARVAG